MEEMMLKALESYGYASKDSSGRYYLELYTSQCKEFPSESIAKMEDGNPYDIYNDALQNTYADAEFDMIKEFYDESVGRDEPVARDCDFEKFRDLFYEVAYVKYPDFMNQELEINILLDTGDMNYDFVCNDFYPHYNGIKDDVIEKESSILWLVKQQGYNKSLLNTARKGDSVVQNDFLETVVEEVANCSTHMNALTFLVRMTLGQYIDLLEMMWNEKDKNSSVIATERKGRSFITIGKDCMCGLTDVWNGAGSCLNIKLEKDVRLPIRYIFRAMLDRSSKYTVGSVYGMCRSAWIECMSMGNSRKNLNKTI